MREGAYPWPAYGTRPAQCRESMVNHWICRPGSCQLNVAIAFGDCGPIPNHLLLDELESIRYPEMGSKGCQYATGDLWYATMLYATSPECQVFFRCSHLR